MPSCARDVVWEMEYDLCHSGDPRYMPDEVKNSPFRFQPKNEDPGLGAYIHLRLKFLAHLAEPKSDVPKPIYKEVFDIARNTARCFGDLANGTGIVRLEIDTQIPAQKESAVAFWKPWLRAEEQDRSECD